MILCFNLEAKDFVVNCNQCIIGIGWTEVEIELIKKRMGEDNFYIVADDANYYSYKLREYIKANGIEYKHISRLEEDYTRVIFPNAVIEIKDREKDSIMVYYMYEKGKKPYVIQDIVMPEDEINAYFNITNK
ncbi:MAG: hypothetical protein HDT10_05205 [Helicobacter sp.]|nr:hypothetical protein [Helicobacter sp.]